MCSREYDVIVAGLGTAGAIALIQCARLGLKTFGIERINQMGGTGTAGGIGSYYYGSKGGMYEELNEKAAKLQEIYFKTNGYALPGAKAVVLEKEAIAAGAEFVYNAVITEVIQKDHKVCGVVYSADGKSTCLQAKVLIDTTGEGEVAQLCGCAFTKGRVSDGKTQPYTNCVFIADPAARIENKDAGHINMQDNTEMSNELLRANTLPFYLKDAYGKEKIYLTNAPFPGVREGQLIEGEEKVTLNDALSAKQQKNTIFYAYSNVDKHAKDVAFEGRQLKDWYLCAGLWSVNMSVAVPMGAVIPKGKEGLLVGGRALSVDCDIAACIRMKSDMEKCGEAMADMAYLAIRCDCRLKDVPYAKLKAMLEKTGCLDEKNNVGFYNRTKNGLEKVEWAENEKQLKEDLRGDRSGFGIWAAKKMGKKVQNKLAEWLDEGGDLAQNAAIALALSEDRRALPLLRKMAQERDMRIPKTGFKFVQTVGVTAVYLLGRLADTESVPILENIVQDHGACEKAAVVSDEMYTNAFDVAFQFYSNAVVALLDIAEQKEERKAEIFAFLQKQVLENEENAMMVTLKGGGCAADMANEIKAYVKKRISA